MIRVSGMKRFRGSGSRFYKSRGRNWQMILNAIPKRWFSWDFNLMDGTGQVAEIDVAWWREQGLLTVRGVPYKVYREGLASGAFILETGGSVVARAEKPSAFHRCFVIEYGGRLFTLRAKSAFGREFILFDDGPNEIGFIAPEGIFTRRAIAGFPEELPLPVKAFIMWLVIIIWKRDSDSGPSAGGTGII
jgi:hypothetical protein